MSPAPDWFPTFVMTTVLGVLISVIGYLLSDKLKSIVRSNEELDRKVDKIADRHISDMERHIELYHRPRRSPR